MYKRDIARLPEAIPRSDFVDLIFTIGDEHCHGYDTIVAAVQIGDSFVHYSKKWDPFIPDNTNPNTPINPVLQECVPQCYSVELAYVATILSAKLNEDLGLRHTNTAVETLENCYIYKMEWEIYYLLHTVLSINNFVTTIGKMSTGLLPSVFLDICWDICLNEKVLYIPHQTIIAAILILGRNKKLDAVDRHKRHRFTSIMKKMSREYELDYSSVLRAYIEHKSECIS